MVQEKDDARERMLVLADITPEQQVIIDVFLREKSEKIRHWERRTGDDSIYIEYLNGTILLENLIDREISNINRQNQKKRK